MRRIVSLLLAAVSLGAAPPTKPDPADEADLKALQGEWHCLSANSNGKELPDVTVSAVRFTFRGQRALFSFVHAEADLRVVLYPGRTPKAMDLVEEGTGKRFPTLYRLDGDILIYCTAIDGTGHRRPAAIRPGNGLGIVKLKRKKP